MKLEPLLQVLCMAAVPTRLTPDHPVAESRGRAWREVGFGQGSRQNANRREFRQFGRVWAAQMLQAERAAGQRLLAAGAGRRLTCAAPRCQWRGNAGRDTPLCLWRGIAGRATPLGLSAARDATTCKDQARRLRPASQNGHSSRGAGATRFAACAAERGVKTTARVVKLPLVELFAVLSHPAAGLGGAHHIGRSGEQQGCGEAAVPLRSGHRS
eukprot:scaffold27823_cov129-Isochrysis_galbana.AAC.2